MRKADVLALYEASLRDNPTKQTFEDMGTYSTETCNYHHVINWIVMGLQPLSEVDDPDTRDLFLGGSITPMCHQSLQKYWGLEIFYTVTD